MTRDDIIAMALQAGFEEYESSSLSGNSELDQTLQVGEYPVGETVFKFAILVAAAEREQIIAANAPEIERINAHIKALEEAVAAEREACARVCDQQGVGRKALEHYAALTYSGAAHDCAAAIRARGDK